MSADKKETEALIEKVEQCTAKAPEFSQEELVALRAMMAAWRGWLILGKASKWLIVSLGLLAGFVVSMNTLTAALRDWLR